MRETHHFLQDSAIKNSPVYDGLKKEEIKKTVISHRPLIFCLISGYSVFISPQRTAAFNILE